MTVVDRYRPFARVAIVNRGEPAVRFLHAAAEFPEPLTTIALHTADERRATFVRLADEAVCFDDLAGATPDVNPYLDLGLLRSAVLAADADAVWVGWGFVAERAEFVDLCDELGVVFIGPSGDVMRRLGDKIGAKHLAAEVDVPMAPWSQGAVEGVDAAESAAAEIGFPLMVKATAGGGGRGIRKVDAPAELAAAVTRASEEGARSFGDPTVFLERVVERARHVEVQVVADAHGTAWAPGVRDCSVQRRNQKVFEESSSTALTPAHEATLRDAAVRLARHTGYVGVGTVEFLFQPDEDLLAFLEVNTRLQVEHTITEQTTGLDLVQLQLHVAMGRPLEGEMPPVVGHSIEVRLNAEDPAADFAPAPGRVVALELPAGPGIRVDTGVALGDEISPRYDSMIAKIIATGTDRDHALRRIARALDETTVLVDGGTTNLSFLRRLVRDDVVVDGRFDTRWLDGRRADDDDHGLALAVVVGAIMVHDQHTAADRRRLLTTAARGRPECDDECGHEVELRAGSRSCTLRVETGDGRGWYRLHHAGGVLDARLERLDHVHARLHIGDVVHRIVSQTQGVDLLVEVDGAAHRLSRDDGGLVRAPTVALVVSVDVHPGEEVRAGQRIAVLEAMKMETVLVAPADGVVDEVFVAPNVQVDGGASLLRIRPAGEDTDAPGGAIDLPVVDGGGAADAVLDVVEGVFLGFDVAVTDHLATTVGDGAADATPAQRARQRRLLRVFADLCGLTRERRSSSGQDLETRSPREQFNAFLRAFDATSGDLTDSFRARLVAGLAHYGVRIDPDVAQDHTPDLEDAVYRVHRAAQRRDDAVPLVLALLGAQEHAALDDGAEQDDLRETLDRVIAATQARYPAVGNLARSVRHRRIDAPLIDAARAGLSESIAASIDDLVADPDDPLAVEALVETPTLIMPRVAEVDAFGSSPAVRTAFAEVFLRRFYKIRDLVDVHRSTAQAAVTARYHHRGRNVFVVATSARRSELSAALATVRRLADGMADRTVVDLYVRLDPGDDDAALEAAMESALAGADLPDAVHRVAVVGTVGGSGGPEIVHRSWHRRPGEPRLEPDLVARGMHPMVGRRLHLWRLENFDVTRLESDADTHVFDCVARDVPGDERLIAVAEVRDATPLRDAEGRLVALPELERVLAACIDGLRRALAANPDRRRLEWNRVLLYVWPIVEISLDEVTEVAKRLVPITTGLGIEQVLVQGFVLDPATQQTNEVVFRLGFRPGQGLTLRITEPPTEPMQPLDDYARKVLACRRRNTVYPYELIPAVTTVDDARPGRFVELDLADGASDELVEVHRPHGTNDAGVIIGRAVTPTAAHPAGIDRLVVFGDPTKAMGSITGAECRRLLAAIDLAEAEGIPIDWYALSAGARIAMDSGSENLDWVAAVLRRLVEFTQAGGVVHVVVAGINVGAQPYWNAESTMLMHTKGALIMTPDSAMVLTGKQAIDFSGGVSAEDNIGIGGHERIMGPNGQAQYWAEDVVDAVALLHDHHDLTYAAAGAAGPPRTPTIDPIDRDVRGEPHRGDPSFTTVGEIFDLATNPDRKKPFDIRSVMKAVVDSDRHPLERWADMADAEGAVVWDARLGGDAVTVIGVESRPLPRSGGLPADGPTQWSAGTLFPLSSKKVARAINAASGNRPVVVLANLSGFDGSPESLRRLQLEYGAEIGRAIVNFDGPIVLCVISRYHGGAFVVFSGRLNDRMQVLAVEGAHASVIGGAPAAAVVFGRDVDARTGADPRVRAAEADLERADPEDRARRRAELDSIRADVRNEMLGVVAAEFDAVHSVERARTVGSVHEIVPAAELRPALVAAVRRGLGGS